MPLERLTHVPKFEHKIDEYELARMEATDAYIARKHSEFHQALEWNNRQTLELNHAAVNTQEDIESVKEEVKALNARFDAWDNRWNLLVARVKSPISIIGFFFVLFSPVFVTWLLERFFGK